MLSMKHDVLASKKLSSFSVVCYKFLGEREDRLAHNKSPNKVTKKRLRGEEGNVD